MTFYNGIAFDADQMESIRTALSIMADEIGSEFGLPAESVLQSNGLDATTIGWVLS